MALLALLKVLYSAAARQDLRNIYEYIAYVLKAPTAARTKTNKILLRAASLGEMPRRCKLYDTEPWRGRGLRVCPVDSYIIFYTVQENTNTVNVVRIMYGGRDIDRCLD